MTEAELAILVESVRGLAKALGILVNPPPGDGPYRQAEQVLKLVQKKLAQLPAGEEPANTSG